MVLSRLIWSTACFVSGLYRCLKYSSSCISFNHCPISFFLIDDAVVSTWQCNQKYIFILYVLDRIHKTSQHSRERQHGEEMERQRKEWERELDIERKKVNGLKIDFVLCARNTVLFKKEVILYNDLLRILWTMICKIATKDLLKQS